MEEKIIFEDDRYVVRARVDKDGDLIVKAHRKDASGKEWLPAGYLLGSNMLVMETKK